MRKCASAALLTFLVFAAFFATAQRALAGTGIPDTGAIEATVDPTVQAPPVSTTVSQDAGTEQAAISDANAVEPEQSNSIEAAPTDNSGALNASQENDVAVTGAAANGSATSQEAGGESTATGPPSETDQQAATDQAANTTASAVEPHQSNVVIIIRINSPGDDVISQTNVVSVVGVAANESSTAQGQSPSTQNPAPAGASASGTSDPTQSPAGGPTPPTDGQPQPSGAVPQSAQSAKAAEPLVQPADAVQGQRPHGARALSILGSVGGSNASPPAPESKAVSAPRSAAGDDDSVAGREKDASTVAPVGSAMATRGASSEHTVAHPSDGRIAGKVGAILKKVVSWPGKHSGAVRSAAKAEGAEGGWNLGLTTLAILLAGLVGWVALAWLPSLRGLPRPRIGG
jgi:hypothetical protein